MEATIVSVLFGSFIILLIIGAPITVSLGVAAMAAFLYLDENPIKFVQIAFTSVGAFPLMALPAFILVSVNGIARLYFGWCVDGSGGYFQTARRNC